MAKTFKSFWSIGSSFYLFFYWSGFVLPLAAQQEKIRTEIDKILRYDAEWDKEQTPGFLIAIVDGDSSWIFSYGENLDREKDKLSSEDLFYIGGLGLVITAKEIITSETDLNTRLKDLDDSWQEYPIGDLTIASILNHSAGLSKIPKGIGKIQSDPSHPYKDWTKKHAYNYYRSLKSESLNDHWNYSYHGYALLVDELFKTCEVIYNNEATPGLTKSKRIAKASNWGHLSSLLAGKQSITEMITLSRSLIPILPLLTEVETAHKDVYHNGLMYHSTHAKKYEVFTHAGRSDGHYVHMSIVPQTESAVIIMANGEVGLNDLGILVLRMINHNWKRK